MAFSDYSATPSSNGTIASINIAEGCPPANINNAIRQIMADAKAFDNAKADATLLVTKAAAVFTGTQPIYDGRGAYVHWNNSALTSGRRYVQAEGSSLPTGLLPGDEILEY